MSRLGLSLLGLLLAASLGLTPMAPTVHTEEYPQRFLPLTTLNQTGPMASMVYAEEYPEGLAAYWRFHEGAGTTVEDSVGGYVGNILGATWSPGIAGTGLCFDGINDYVVVDGFPKLRENFSVELWLQVRGPSCPACKPYNTFFCDGWASWQFDHMLAYGYNFPNKNWDLYDSSGWTWYLPHDIGTGWVHFVITYSGNTESLFVNGALKAQRTVATPLPLPISGTDVLYLGAAPGDIQYINGCMDEVAIYNRPLTSEEILRDYQSGLAGAGYETAAPVVAVTFPSPSSGSSSWFNAQDAMPVVGQVTANDTETGGSSIVGIECTGATVGPITGLGTLQATASLTVDSEGSHSVVCTAKDSAQNSGAAPGSSNTAQVDIDRTQPVVTCGVADGLWHAEDVSIGCTASDDGSGLANSADSSFDLGTAVANNTETDEASTGTRDVCDVAGNCVTAGPIGGNRVDKKAPDITISAPSNTSYLLGQAVAADYGCVDGGSGVTSCAGTVDDGAAIDTDSVGAKGFAVNAIDTVGNSASASAFYNVVFDWAGFFPPVDNLPTLNAAKAGSAIPVKFSLGGDQGLDIFPATYPKVVQVACSADATIDEIEQTTTASSNNLSYNAATGQYNFVWKTEKSWAQTCRQLVVRLVDGTDHLANFKFK